MSVTAKWLDDSKTVVLREFSNNWTWDDFYQAQNHVVEMLNSVDHKVDQVFDFSQSRALPPNVITHIGNSGRNMPDNRGKSIVILQSTFYQTLYRVISRIFPAIAKNVIITDTREKALAHLDNQQASV